MGNMSYCRFENTYHDLIDCFDNIWNEAENERDERYRKNMIRFLKDRLDEIEEFKQGYITIKQKFYQEYWNRIFKMY